MVESALSREAEEAVYAEAMAELENGTRRHGLWAKALISTQGDEKKAVAEYLKLRVQSIADETVLTAVRESAANEIARQLQKERSIAEKKQEYLEAQKEEYRRQKEAKEVEDYWTYASFLEISQKFQSVNAEVEKVSVGWEVRLPNGSVQNVKTRVSLGRIFDELNS